MCENNSPKNIPNRFDQIKRSFILLLLFCYNRSPKWESAAACNMYRALHHVQLIISTTFFSLSFPLGLNLLTISPTLLVDAEFLFNTYLSGCWLENFYYFKKPKKMVTRNEQYYSQINFLDASKRLILYEIHSRIFLYSTAFLL